jgi:hypothetical protein
LEKKRHKAVHNAWLGHTSSLLDTERSIK